MISISTEEDFIEEIEDDNIRTLFTREYNSFPLDDDMLIEDMKRAVSIRKMIKNYKSRKKTNYRLLLNHIIIIQNSLGVQKTVYILRSILNSSEIIYLDAFLYFLKYIEYNEEISYDLLRKIRVETK